MQRLVVSSRGLMAPETLSVAVNMLSQKLLVVYHLHDHWVGLVGKCIVCAPCAFLNGANMTCSSRDAELWNILQPSRYADSQILRPYGESLPGTLSCGRAGQSV